jgi:hypothetical protein
VAAIFTGLAGVITAWAGLVKIRGEGARDCEERLARARAEAEEIAARMHTERMRELE